MGLTAAGAAAGGPLLAATAAAVVAVAAGAAAPAGGVGVAAALRAHKRVPEVGVRGNNDLACAGAEKVVLGLTPAYLARVWADRAVASLETHCGAYYTPCASSLLVASTEGAQWLFTVIFELSLCAHRC